ncbi:MAG: C4-dicarboxylate transporter DctA [Rickettsiales bacterium]|nr:C4-dicarboxylate transporter DctA [Rickettsiales bacterium]
MSQIFFTKIRNSLYFQVLIAVIMAIIFGYFFPKNAQAMKAVADAFIALIKMCVPPIIFCTIVSGIIGGDGLKKVGKVGLKTLIYFEVLTIIALIIGLIITHFLKPGIGMNIDVTKIDSSSISSYVKPHLGFVDFLLNIIPTTIFQAFVSGEILSILLVAVLFGLALSNLKERSKSIVNAINELTEILFKIISYIMKLAPIGAFAAMSFTVGKYGISSLAPLMKLMLIFYLTCIFFIVVVLGLVLKLCQSSIFKLLRHIKEEIFLVLGTSSSESALPSLIKKMEQFGCPKTIVGLVIPSGYSFNLDGTCIYFTMAIIFIAQAFNIDLSITQLLSIIFVLLFTSKGAAGVTGSGFVTLAATLAVVQTIPLAGLTLILGIDRFMSEARAITNLIGNATATVAISKWEQEFKNK